MLFDCGNPLPQAWMVPGVLPSPEILESLIPSAARATEEHGRLGPKLRRSSIVTCQGSRGWDNFRLLHHFDSRQPLDSLRSTD
jgi:hypothetical protein